MEIELKRYRKGTKHKVIFADWETDDYFEYWKMFYDHKSLIIRKRDDGYISLIVDVPDDPSKI